MRSRSTKWILAITSIASLLACIASAVAVFQGALDADRFKWIFLIATLIWFLSATALSLIRTPAT